MKSAKKILFILFFSLLFLIPSISKAECIDDGFCNNQTSANCVLPAGCSWRGIRCETAATCTGRTQAACTAPRCSWSFWGGTSGTNDNTGGTTGTNDNTNGNANVSVKLDNPLGSVTTPQVLIGKIINSVLGVVGSLALLMFIFGGLTWMTSAGSADKVKKGKDIIVWSAIGLVVIFASYGLVRFLILNIK